ncbi:protein DETOXIFICATION 42 [Prunus persica]|uniref:protein DETOXIFICATION 42 n=1 Tax=Prunus persica TaxID=3760 RepID=UPI0009AB6AB4|nr:protein DETOXIFICATION 42 [Prunus persica]
MTRFNKNPTLSVSGAEVSKLAWFHQKPTRADLVSFFFAHSRRRYENDSYSNGKKSKTSIYIFLKDCRFVFNLDKLGLEIASIALPAALALTADPIASLVDTAFIGQIGPVELAAVGVSIALFNQASRIAILPLLSVATSFVAEEDTIGTASPKANQSDYLETGLSINGETKQLIPKRGTDQNAYNSKPVGASFEIVTTNHRKRYIPSVSPAMVIGSILGLIQAIFLISAAKPLLNFMGVSFKWRQLLFSCATMENGSPRRRCANTKGVTQKA